MAKKLNQSTKSIFPFVYLQHTQYDNLPLGRILCKSLFITFLEEIQ